MKKVLMLICMLSTGSLCWAQATAPSLGSAAKFAVLGSSTVTNGGPTVITGNLGVAPGTSITGFPPGTVNGAIDAGDLVALVAQANATKAYAALKAETCMTPLTGQDLGGMTLSPGVYCFTSSAQLTGQLTLNGNGVYVFQIGSTLTTAASSSVVLTNGALCGNVFWQVGSSATLGATNAFVGSILALASDTVGASTSIAGRVIALTAAVTLDTDNITVTGCSGGGGGGGGHHKHCCANEDDDCEKDNQDGNNQDGNHQDGNHQEQDD
jgi:hypothetical protein